MDNASKALIIAGAILIAVMLVSLGVMLYNTAAGVAETTVGSVDALGVAGFNAQFETYLGTGKSKSQAAGLISKILANNANNDIIIYVDFTSTNTSTVASATGAWETSTLSTIRDGINAVRNVRYDITVDTTNGYNQDGTIKTIVVTMVNR